MNAITKLPFQGDVLDVVTKDGHRGVTLASLCQPFGLDPEGQRIKLARLAWAVTFKVKATGRDGKSYDTVCLDLASINGWLFTLQTKGLAPEVRAKLIAYQRECADVLADHFLGKRGAPATTALAAAETFAQQASLVRDDPRLTFEVRRAIRRACFATKRSWAAVEAMVRKSTRAQGWTLIAAFNAPSAIALLEAVEAGIVLVPRKPGKVRALPNAGRQTTLPFRS